MDIMTRTAQAVAVRAYFLAPITAVHRGRVHLLPGGGTSFAPPGPELLV